MVAPAVPEFVTPYTLWPKMLETRADTGGLRILEDDIHIAVDTRTEALQSLRELGPPDLVHLVKHAVKSPTRQVIGETRSTMRSRHEKLTGL